MLHKQLSKLELTGSFVAIACAIHCISIPIIVSFGGIKLLNQIGHGAIEIGFLIATITLAGWSIIANYTKKYVNSLPIAFFVIGFIALITSILFHLHILSAVGGILIASAHFFNWKQLRKLKRS